MRPQILDVVKERNEANLEENCFCALEELGSGKVRDTILVEYCVLCEDTTRALQIRWI